MSYLVFARKYRPKTFDEVTGQEHITKNLENALLSGKLAHAYIFSGPRGVGKTSSARILAKSLNCKDAPTLNPCGECDACREITDGRSLDVIEIDGASNRGIDDIRTLRENVKFASGLGKYKIYIIDEVHQITSDGFNALLKTLEEPPAHVKFIFATTALNKIPLTIRSRCQKFEFRPISTLIIAKKIEEISKLEGINIDSEAIFAIARASDGSLRDAESILDQLSSFTKDKISLGDVTSVLGITEDDLFMPLVDKIIQNDTPAALEILDNFLSRGRDVAGFISQLVWYFRNLMIAKSIKTGLDKFLDIQPQMYQDVVRQAEKISLSDILNSINILIAAQEMLKRVDSQRIPLEIAIIKLSRKKEAPIIAQKMPDNRIALASPANKHVSEPAAKIVYTESGKNSVNAPVHVEPLRKVVNLEEIVKVWETIVQDISQSKMSLATYLNEGSLLKIENNILSIAFPARFKFHKEALEKKENSEIIEKKLSECFNTRVKLNFVISENDPASTDIVEPAIKSTIEAFKGRIVSKIKKE